MMGFGSSGYFVTCTLCLNIGHSYRFPSSVGHPRANSIGLLVYDGMHIYIYIWGTNVIVQVTRYSANPTGNRLIYCVDYLELNYDVTLVTSIYTRYLCCTMK